MTDTSIGLSVYLLSSSLLLITSLVISHIFPTKKAGCVTIYIMDDSVIDLCDSDDDNIVAATTTTVAAKREPNDDDDSSSSSSSDDSHLWTAGVYTN